MRVQVNRNIDFLLHARDERIRIIRQQKVCHVLDADRVRTHLNELFGELDKVVLVMNRGHRVADRGLADAAVLLGVANRALEVARIVQRIEDTDDVNAVFNRFFAELLHHVVRIMLVTKDVLSAEQHLQFGVGKRFAQRSQALPRVFVEEAKAGVKRSAAPDFQRPVADGIEHFASGKHIFGAHARRSQRLVRIAEDRIGNH